MEIYNKYQSVIGEIYIVVEDNRISSVHIGVEDFSKLEDHKTTIYDDQHPLLLQAAKQLEEYFLGKRKEFDLPLSEKGTEFQMKVWQALKNIPYGKTASYQDVAVTIGNEKAVRAIGQANRANKLPIIIPCHRVIGKNKKLTGYAGKRVNIKEQLLQLEGASFKK